MIKLRSIRMDQTDRRILTELQHDGRMTNAELAHRVGIAATSLGDRLRRLARTGVISGYTVLIDPHQIDLSMLVFVEVLLDKTTDDVFDRFSHAVQRAPEVLECHLVAGGFDYLIKARVRDMPAYRRFLSDVLHTLPGVRETRTYAVMEEVKSGGPLPL